MRAMGSVVFTSLLLLGATAASAAAPADGATALALSGLPVAYAAGSFESPVGFGGSWGSVGLGFLYGPGSEGHDSSMALAVGFGDADEFAALDVATVISSLSASEGGDYGFGEEGSFAVKLHRNLGNYTSVAIGASAIGRWGGEVYMDKNPPGYYAAVSKAVFWGDRVLMLSGGAGHNVTNKTGNGFDVFGSLAVYLTPWLSLIAEDNGHYANAAISVAPLPFWLPLTITTGYVDLLSQHNAHPEWNIIAAVGYHF